MKTQTQKNTERRTRRHARVRAKISGTPERPRLSVFRSNKYIYAQLIDDTTGTTLAAADSRTMKEKTGVARATAVGAALAEAAKAKKISEAVFDRGGFLFTGNVKAVAEGAREGGLTL